MKLVLASLVLILLHAIGAQESCSVASAASYQKTDSTVVDPIQYTFGGDHHHLGPDLQPGVFLGDSDLIDADLNLADLSGENLSPSLLNRSDLRDSDMTNVNLFALNLSGAKLSGANFSFADMSFVDVSGASFIGTNLFDTLSLDDTFGSAYYDSDTNFTNFDPVSAGWVLVPEPNSCTPTPSRTLLGNEQTAGFLSWWTTGIPW
jgi:uncharacterized protein YjbI with pentapeptide repeats